MSLAAVRDLREARSPAGPGELAAFETDVLAGFVLARAAAGLADAGHVGDCQGYHGWIVGITTGASPAVSAWVTRAIAGGIWGSSGIASDGTSLYFATGNSKSSASAGPNTSSGDSNPDNWGDAETVFKFPTSLTSPAPATTTDCFLPSNWVALDDADADMGGTRRSWSTFPAPRRQT